MEGMSGMNAWELIRAGGALMAPHFAVFFVRIRDRH